MALPLRQCLRSANPQRSSTRCLHSNHQRPSIARSLPPRRWHYQHRPASSFASDAKSLFRQSPVGVTLAGATILVGVAALVLTNYYYQTYIIGAFHKYPEPVAKKLRKALYFTNTDLNPQEAIKFYRQALQVADEEGMDPFSDEIMGVKIQVAGLMEQIQQWPKAVEVLERVRNDNLEWLRRFGGRSELKKARTRILAKTCAINVKLGELYGHPAIYDRDMAEERLVWAVETALKEKQRRQNERVDDEVEGPWMSDSEMGATLESLAHTYEEKDQHYLATPLFLQALNLQQAKDCHTVILMNNLASSLAQQSPRAARAVQSYAQSSTISNSESANSKPSGPVATKQQMLDNARMWAQKALDIAGGIKPPERNEECDVGCVVAMHNLGEFAEMSQDTEGARKKYGEAVSLAKGIGFQEGVERGEERLKALKG